MFSRLRSSSGFHAFVAWVEKYERHVGVGALVLGFIFDTLTLGRPDQLFGNITLGGYLFICAGCILLLSLYGRREKAAPAFILAFLQFCFGNLASGLLVLYGQSGTFEGSFLFFLVIGGFLIGNEFLRERYTRLNFHIGAWYLLLLGYLVILVPVLSKQIGTLVFFESVAVALGLVFVLVFLLYILSPRSFAGMKWRILRSVTSVSVVFVSLYLLNVLPPVPLSVQSIGIYHSVVRTESGYAVTYEKPSWHEFFRSTNETFKLSSGEGAYCFSAVFAPGGLSTSIVHRWEHYDDSSETWKTESVFTFPITGGRYDGYRGYSVKVSPEPGKWRCLVETARGALIGRTTFSVVSGEASLTSATL